MPKLHLSILIGDFKHMALHCHHYTTRQRLFLEWQPCHLSVMVFCLISSIWCQDVIIDLFCLCTDISLHWGNCHWYTTVYQSWELQFNLLYLHLTNLIRIIFTISESQPTNLTMIILSFCSNIESKSLNNTFSLLKKSCFLKSMLLTNFAFDDL